MVYKRLNQEEIEHISVMYISRQCETVYSTC